MANIFDFRNELIAGYRTFSRSFTKFAAPDIDQYVTSALDAAQTFCPEPLIQINPSYAEDSHSLIYYTTQLGARGVPMLHERCAQIFALEREGKREPLQLYRHQGQAITYADEGHSYIVTSGTGSGKSLTFFIPMVSRILQEKELDPTPRIRAIIVYPMNALANSQLEEINKFLSSVTGTIKVQRYTGQERASEREGLRNGTEVPDILLTNYMMLEFMLLRPEDSKIIAHCHGLNFLVLDELHTYRGRQGSDVALLVKRLRQRVGADAAGHKLICIGTSATMSSVDEPNSQMVVAQFGRKIFGEDFKPEWVIKEELERETDPQVCLADFATGAQANANCERLAQEVAQAARGDFSFVTKLPAGAPAGDLEPSLRAFKQSRLAIWLELMLSTELFEQGHHREWRRAQPKGLDTVVAALQEAMGTAAFDADTVRTALINFMNFISDPEQHQLRTKLGRTPFAFKLHQFISSPGQLSVSLEAPRRRQFALDGRNYFVAEPQDVHAAAAQALDLDAADALSAAVSAEESYYPAFEVRFCLHCGQEYLPVWLHFRLEKQGKGSRATLEKVLPRELTTTSPDAANLGLSVKIEPGFVCPVRADQGFTEAGIELCPADWRDPEDSGKLKKSYRDYEPKAYYLDRYGKVCASSGPYNSSFWVFKGDFQFCLKCGERSNTQANIHNRLIGLSGEGRSTASTTLSLLTLRQLFQGSDKVDATKRKLLGFSDNRQDAALQAGHFNDFVKNLTLRSCLMAVLEQYLDESAAENAPGLRLDAVVKRMEQLLGWGENLGPSAAGRELFLANPGDELMLAPQVIKDDYYALHSLLSYHLTLDLSQSYLYTSPGLERLGLLSIDYCGLDELCAQDALFAPANDVTGQTSLLTHLTPEYRRKLFMLLLDELKRRKRLKAEFLTESGQLSIRTILNRDFAERWQIGREEWRSVGEFVCLDAIKSKDKPRVGGKPWILSTRSRLNRQLRNHNLWKDFWREHPELKPLMAVGKDEVQDLLVAMCQYLKAAHILLENKYHTVDSYYSIDVNMILWRPGPELVALKAQPVGSDFDPELAHGKPGYFYRELYRIYAQDFRDFSAKCAVAVHQAVELKRDELPAIFSFEAHEHTAQLSNSERQELEMRFRGGDSDRAKWQQLPGHEDKSFRRLPLLFCSPTMELGIDISALNFVYMRNVPPTAANYVQRAGRAGRSGQPALVVTYCTSRNAHDQWFFKHPQDMVQGVVREPTLDLANDALLKAHLHSIWLSCALSKLPPEITFKSQVAQLLTGIEPGRLDNSVLTDPEIKNALNDETFKQRLRQLYAIKPEIAIVLKDDAVRKQAYALGRELIENLVALAPAPERALLQTQWLDEGKSNLGLSGLMRDAYDDFDRCFDYWRELYFTNLRECAELAQQTDDFSERRTAEVKEQLRLLSGAQQGNSTYSDFYIFRYLAGQGFLPGYSFPAQPLLAWIPSPEGSSLRARRGSYEQRGDWLSRARFLGINEFGPNNLIYHNGRIYRCTRLKLSAGVGIQEERSHQVGTLSTMEILVCPHCGHYVKQGVGEVYNSCQHCKQPYEHINKSIIKPLYKVSVVETTRKERITAADEERQRQGFDLRTFYHFNNAESNLRRYGVLGAEGTPLAFLSYGASSNIMRANLGLRGHEEAQPGFYINAKNGEWLSQEKVAEAQKSDSKIYAQVKPERIIPYVSDMRNIMIMDLSPYLQALGFDVSSEHSLAPDDKLQVREIMATLQAALVRAITKHFQIELSEIFIEPLPNRDAPKQLLIYESGEGGSGILNRLCSLPEDGKRPSLAAVAAQALEIMHYERTGDLADLPWDPEQQEEYDRRPECRGCYDCVLTYYNQPDHAHINRKNQQVFALLAQLTESSLEPFGAPSGANKRAHASADDADQATTEHEAPSGVAAQAPADETKAPEAENKAPATEPTASAAAASGVAADTAVSPNCDRALLNRFCCWLAEEGYKVPKREKMPWYLKSVNYALAGAYFDAGCALSFEPIPDNIAAQLKDYGIVCLQLNPDGSDWAEVFAANCERFKLLA